MTSKNYLSFVASTDFDGGAEKYIAELAKMMAGSNRSVRLLGNLRTWPKTIEHVSVGCGPKWSLRTLPKGVLRLVPELRSLRRLIGTKKGDVYNLHFKREQIGFTFYLSSVGRVVWTEHGRFPSGLFGFLIQPFYRLAAGRVDAIVCVSSLVAKDIARRVSNPGVISVIDTAVDVTRFFVRSEVDRSSLKERFGLDDRPVVLFIGRIEASKRPDLAIRAGLAVGAQVVVAGEGSYLEDLKHELAARSDVRFLGHVADASELYGLADVHVFSSNGSGEGFPTVIIESAASGVPTVGTSDAGFGYAIDAAGGVSCLPSEHDIARAIEEVLVDLAPRRLLARTWAESRDQDAWARQYEAVFFPEKL